jgi:hypothetical protein
MHGMIIQRSGACETASGFIARDVSAFYLPFADLRRGRDLFSSGPYDSFQVGYGPVAEDSHGGTVTLPQRRSVESSMGPSLVALSSVTCRLARI